MALNTDQLLDETKQIVKSLVILYPNGVKLETLCEEYEQFEGKSLPFRELGFKYLTQFLSTVPDIEIDGNVYNYNSVILRPVSDPSTAHILDMVCHQNRRKNKRNVYHNKSDVQRNNYHYRRPQRTISGNIYKNQRSGGILNKKITKESKSNTFIIKDKSQIEQSVRFSKQTEYFSNKNSFYKNFNITIINELFDPEYERKPNCGQPMSRMSNDNQIKYLPYFSRIEENLIRLMSIQFYSQGFMLFNFNAIYKHLFNEVINFKRLGYSSLFELLQQFPHILEVIPIGFANHKVIPTKKFTHVNQLYKTY